MAKISVQVKPLSKREGVEKMIDGSYLVRVSSPPAEGMANIRVVELLSEFLGIPKSRIQILRGLASKKKIVDIS